ncbi:MAG TPA: BON domain-containing protein [Thermoanaerobaculia bacterium]|jgi:hypothetical protein
MNTKEKWSLVGSAGVGAGVGAGLMYLLDPQGGRGRRAVAKDKSVSALKKGGAAAAKTSRHLGNKTKGLIADAGGKLRDSDLVGNLGDLKDQGQALLAKVQRKVRRAVSYPAAIQAVVEEGKVILQGLVLASEVAGLLVAIEAVEGVTEVQNYLEVHESAQDLAAFRNGARRWVGPATRVLTGGTGSALAVAALKRQDKLGAALGVVGLGLLAHGLTNFNARQLAARVKNGRAEKAAPVANLDEIPLDEIGAVGVS